MNYKILIFILLLISCTTTNYKQGEKLYNTTGFAYIFNLKDYEEKIVNKKYDSRSMAISHHFLKPGTSLKITNPETGKNIILKTTNKVKYPNFYKVLITNEVAKNLKINKDIPYVEIQELKLNKSFVAKKAKMFNEEKKIFNSAPVEKVKIDNISVMEKSKVEKIKKFSIIIAEFYSNDSAKLLKNKLIKDLPTLDKSKLTINVKNSQNVQLLSGPYDSINLLEKDYMTIKKIGFEELEILLND